MNKLKIFLLLALVVSMVSCKHKPKPSNKLVAIDTTQIAPVNVSQADMVLLNTLKKSVAQQDTFNKVEIKFNIDFRSETQSHSGSGTIRMIKDSLIWISISALGIEAGRALMTPDSVKFIFKLKNKYFAGDYSYLRRFLPVRRIAELCALNWQSICCRVLRVRRARRRSGHGAPPGRRSPRLFQRRI